jgi:hypothetical protein
MVSPAAQATQLPAAQILFAAHWVWLEQLV